MEATVVAGAHRALEVLAAADVCGFSSCDRDGLDVMLAELGRLRGVVAGFEVAIARRSRELAAEGRSECAEALLAEGGWTLTLDPDRTITLTRPDGEVVHKDTTVDRLPRRDATPPDRATADRTDRPPG